MVADAAEAWKVWKLGRAERTVGGVGCGERGEGEARGEWRGLGVERMEKEGELQEE